MANNIKYAVLLATALLIGATLTPNASAGIFEVGGSGNYRISRLDKDNYQEMTSYTGSVSYYFWEMSALELSYTEGEQIVVLKIPTENKTTTTTIFKMAGLDLVITLASKESVIQPYIKAGGAYITKDMYREVETVGMDRLPSQKGLVPSAGAGIKIKFTNTMSLKVGVDAWTSPSNQKPTTIDYAGRAGLSWMF